MVISALTANSSFLSSNSFLKLPLFDSQTRKLRHKNWVSNGLFKVPSLRKNHTLRPKIQLRPVSSSEMAETSNRDNLVEGFESSLKVEIGSPNKFTSLIPAVKLSSSDQAFFLLTFIACTTSVAFASLVAAAVPTLLAMARAATSLSKLADTAREEIPSTMAAIRLSGMEISDLTLELSDLSQEIAEGVTKSTQAVQAAEAGVRQIGSLARRQTMSMIQERANLPVISLQPAVVGAAKKTSQAVGRATKSFMYFIASRGNSGEEEDNQSIEKVEL